MKPFFLVSLTKAVNAYLALDPLSKDRLKSLHGKIIWIELLPLHFIFQLRFTEHKILIEERNESEHAHAELRGTPLRFLGMMLMKDERQRFFADDLSMKGDAELGQRVVELFDELEIDWEDYLSHVVGDIPAHQVGRAVRHAGKWLKHIENKLSCDIREYIQEEKEWLPSSERLQDFFAEIDTLRMDVDRMDARINELRNAVLQHEV